MGLPPAPELPKKSQIPFSALYTERGRRGEGNRAASAEEEEQTRKFEYDGITMTDGWFLSGGLGGKDRTADRKTQLTV